SRVWRTTAKSWSPPPACGASDADLAELVMAIELGIATPAVPRDPAALDDRFGKWARDLGVTVLATHLGPTPEDVLPHAAEARERIVEFLRLVAPRAEDQGIILTLECHMITALDTPPHIREIVDGVGSPAIKVNFDPVNLLDRVDAVYESGARMAAMVDVL